MENLGLSDSMTPLLPDTLTSCFTKVPSPLTGTSVLVLKQHPLLNVEIN